MESLCLIFDEILSSGELALDESPFLRETGIEDPRMAEYKFGDICCSLLDCNDGEGICLLVVGVMDKVLFLRGEHGGFELRLGVEFGTRRVSE